MVALERELEDLAGLQQRLEEAESFGKEQEALVATLQEELSR